MGFVLRARWLQGYQNEFQVFLKNRSSKSLESHVPAIGIDSRKFCLHISLSAAFTLASDDMDGWPSEGAWGDEVPFRSVPIISEANVKEALPKVDSHGCKMIFRSLFKNRYLIASQP